MSDLTPETTVKKQPFRYYSKHTDDPVRVLVVGEWDERYHQLKLAVSRCSAEDQFSRQKARLIAEGRLKGNKLYKTITMLGCSAKEFVDIAREVAKDIISTKYPHKQEGHRYK